MARSVQNGHALGFKSPLGCEIRVSSRQNLLGTSIIYVSNQVNLLLNILYNRFILLLNLPWNTQLYFAPKTMTTSSDSGTRIKKNDIFIDSHTDREILIYRDKDVEIRIQRGSVEMRIDKRDVTLYKSEIDFS